MPFRLSSSSLICPTQPHHHTRGTTLRPRGMSHRGHLLPGPSLRLKLLVELLLSLQRLLDQLRRHLHSE